MALFVTPQRDPAVRLNVTTITEMHVPFDEAVSVSRIRSGDVHRGHLIAFGNRDADSVRIPLRDAPQTTLVLNSGQVVLPPARAYQSMIRELRPGQAWWSDYDLDLLTFDIPGAAIDRRIRETGGKATIDLAHSADAYAQDEVFEGFARAVLPFVTDPANAPRLFIDHVLHSVCAHVVRKFGVECAPRNDAGGLAPWQERRAKEMILANLDAQVSLMALADECRLSVSHFTNAFRQATGETPHQWLMSQRIERAMGYLLSGKSSLASVASQCGFSDQSDFTNAFTKRVGASPGAWRRQRRDTVTVSLPAAVGL